MKKFIFSAVALIAAFAAQAITVSEAFDKIAAIPGVAISDMPQYDVAKEGLDSGKVAMLLGQSPDSVLSVKDQITDAETYETTVEGHHTYIYAQPAGEGKTVVLTITVTPMGPVCMLMQGTTEAALKMLND